jgi:hypothetical protein
LVRLGKVEKYFGLDEDQGGIFKLF